MARRKILSYGEHSEVAPRFREARQLVLDILIRVSKGLGKSSKPAKIAEQILNSFDLKLKHELEEVLFGDYPEVDTKELISLYYAQPRGSKVVLLRSRKSD